MNEASSSRFEGGDRLQLLDTFVRIVEAGSLSAAAAALDTTQPTVSRRLQTLERALGVRLLQRSTHAMRLTADGERCLARAKALLADWADFEADVRGPREALRGTLRVAVPHAFGQDRFVVPLAAFLRQHPQVDVEWLLLDEVRDFIGTGIDCALQVGEPTDPGLVAIRLSQVPRIVVAAPGLPGALPAPERPEDLAALPWLALQTYYRNSVELTHETSAETRRIAIRPRMRTDSLYALRTAALLGLGAAIGSAWLLADDIAAGRLVHLAPAWRAAPLPVNLVYPQARHHPARLLRFVDLMRHAVPAAVEGPG